MKVFGAVVGLAVTLAACFVLGFSFRDLRDLRLPKPERLGRMVGGSPSAETESMAPKQVFKGAFNHILRNYYKPVTKDDLRVAGMQGLVASLGDPHTMFFDS